PSRGCHSTHHKRHRLGRRPRVRARLPAWQPFLRSHMIVSQPECDQSTFVCHDRRVWREQRGWLAVMNGGSGVMNGLTGGGSGHDSTPVPRRTFIPAPLLFVIATAFGISSTLQAYWMGRLESHASAMPNAIPRLLALNLVYWYIPALLAPIVMRFALRHPFDRSHWPRQVALHVTGAFSYSVVHTVVMMGTRALMMAIGGRSPDFPGWRTSTLLSFLTQLDWLLMTYLFLIGLAYALAYRRESEARALNASQLETRLVEAQLQSLQRQLHPHFLFNTLNTISGLIR